MTENQTINDLIAKVEAAIAASENEADRSYSQVDERISAIQAELEAERAKREAIEAELQLQVVGQTMSEIHSFADGLVSEGRLPPALKDMASSLLSLAANLEGDVKSYSLNEEAVGGEMTPYALVSELLKSLPQVGSMRQRATAMTESGKTPSDMRRFSTDSTAAAAVHERVKRLQEMEGLSYVQAFERVRKELN